MSLLGNKKQDGEDRPGRYGKPKIILRFNGKQFVDIARYSTIKQEQYIINILCPYSFELVSLNQYLHDYLSLTLEFVNNTR